MESFVSGAAQSDVGAAPDVVVATDGTGRRDAGFGIGAAGASAYEQQEPAHQQCALQSAPTRRGISRNLKAEPSRNETQWTFLDNLQVSRNPKKTDDSLQNDAWFK